MLPWSNIARGLGRELGLPPVGSDTSRRWALFEAARPVFERSGFRDSTVAELAWASRLRPASLYHYFPSKTALALFPLTSDNGLCASWHAMLPTLPADPLARLNALLDFISSRVDSIGLALRLATEMSDDRGVAAAAGTAIGQARRDFRSMGRSLDPRISDRRADDLFESVASLVVGHVPGVERDAQTIRRQLADLARGWVASLPEREIP
jgi:AcrR family transcriptional regulator